MKLMLKTVSGQDSAPAEVAKILAATLLVAGMLTGCSLLGNGPTRDSDGRVTEAATISARELQTGDCFTFNSPDGSVVAEVTIVPCTQSHEYLVLEQGSLKPADISSAGSLQNAVSSACSDTFTAFKTASTAQPKPTQEFLVFPKTDKPTSSQLYSCIATDAAAIAASDPSPATSTPAP